MLEGRGLVGMGKHVCGAATDLALRCLCPAAVAAAAEGCSPPLRTLGVGIALCCRHLCAWEDYVDQSWVMENGFSPDDFRAMAHMSTWAHQQDTDVQRQTLGLACQRFLDGGRVRFLRRQGLRAVVQEYVTPACTKEN